MNIKEIINWIILYGLFWIVSSIIGNLLNDIIPNDIIRIILPIILLIITYFILKNKNSKNSNKKYLSNSKIFNNIIKIISILLAALIIILILIQLYSAIMYKKEPSNDKIPENYIAVFNGGSGEMTYSTYIYKIDNNQANYGFKYINTINTTSSWGSSEWNKEIVKEGYFNFTDGAFITAEKHGAYDYVKIPNSDKIYTIEEFQDKFLLN